jgi:hypothetical protein
MNGADLSPNIAGGRVAVTRLYDVAYAIDLDEVERHVHTHRTRLKLARARPRSIAYAAPPVDLDLGPTTVRFGGRTCPVTASARLFDFGAIRLSYSLDLGRTDWRSVVTRVDEFDSIAEQPDPWTGDLARVLAWIAPAIEKPVAPVLEIDHTFATIFGFVPRLEAQQILERVDLVPLLTGEHRPLSLAARADVLRNALTYYEDDLVVIGPSRSLIVEPGGEPDVADVLGVAHAQLLELRSYDQLLATELIAMHARVEKARSGIGALARRRYAALAHALYGLHAEITSVSERVENALVVTEDVYLAKVYEAALEQYRVPTWSAGVHRSLELVRDAYSALNDEATSARAEYLEIAIVVLIAVDILIALLV